MPQFDFANVLFAGPCNRSCPFCIGKQVPEKVNSNNLNVFPPRNWQAFCERIRKLGITELIFTGTTTDPQLYRHEQALLDKARSDLPGIKISLHTNGVLAIKKIDTFNAYDRATVSLPSLNATTYRQMMGRGQVPDLARLMAEATIPIKISTIVAEQNIAGISGLLAQFAKLGIQRVALRRLFGDKREWNLLPGHSPVRYYRNNPVYEVSGIEVTWWNFATTTSRSINLFADGTIGSSYLLTQTPEFANTATDS